MAATTDKDEKKMATDVTVSGTGDSGDRKPAPRVLRTEKTGFFHIAKRGQGYWTRMGTAGVALMLVALIAYDIDVILRGQFQVRANVALGITAGVAAVMALFSWWMMNRSTSVDFLIATDSEMKKVNWTSKSDLWGATKVVILFMFLIALLLLVTDVVFGYFFELITVLKTGPFG